MSEVIEEKVEVEVDDDECYLFYRGELVGLFSSKEKAKADATSMWGRDVELEEGDFCGYPVLYIN